MNTSILVKSLNYVTHNYKTCVSLATWINKIFESTKSSVSALIVSLNKSDIECIKVIASYINDISIFNKYISLTFLENKNSVNKLQYEITKILIQNGADIHKNHKRLLSNILGRFNYDMALFLLEHGSSFSCDEFYHCLLHEQGELMYLMVKNDVNLTYQRQLFEWACSRYDYKIIKLIITECKNLDLSLVLTKDGCWNKNFYPFSRQIIDLSVKLEPKHFGLLLVNAYKNSDYDLTNELLMYDLNVSISEKEFCLLQYLIVTKIFHDFNIKDKIDYVLIDSIIKKYHRDHIIKERCVCLCKYGRLDILKIFVKNPYHEIALEAIKYGHLDIFVEYMDPNKLEEYLCECDIFNRLDIIKYIQKIELIKSST